MALEFFWFIFLSKKISFNHEVTTFRSSFCASLLLPECGVCALEEG